jgi:hypothetical protein
LAPAQDAGFNSYGDQHKSKCLEGTQINVLREIRSWCDSPGGEGIYWLKGMAGTGKSTVSRTLAAACYDGRALVDGSSLPEFVCLGATFFFDQGKSDQNNARKLFTTVCKQLADSVLDVRVDICESISSHPNVANELMSNQWKHLILTPLLAWEKRTLLPLTLIVVIDGLDECEDKREISTLLSLIIEAKQLKRVRLRFFITSRPEASILSCFRQFPQGLFAEKELQKVQMVIEPHLGNHRDDITIFLMHELSKVGRTHGLSKDWPGESKIKRLALKSDGLFIYAATACRFLGGSMLKEEYLQKRMDLIFNDGLSISSPQKSLDNIYCSILEHSLPEAALDEEREDIYRLFRRIVGSIIMLLEPLSATTLSNLLLCPQKNIEETLNGLQSVLSKGEDEDSIIEPLHLSFRDFLLDDQRCIKNFWISQKTVHGELLQSCLEVMSNTLKRDICRLGKVAILAEDVALSHVDDYIPAQLRYACRYWVDHLRRAGTEPYDNDGVHEFLKTHFLHWLEAISLMKQMPEGTQAVLYLSKYLFDLPVSNVFEGHKYIISVANSVD